MAVKVWLGGEGAHDIGSRHAGGDEPGVVEALLMKVERSGWSVTGATQWRKIVKYRANVVERAGKNHEDIHNVKSLALVAWEAGCEVLAFARDLDSDERRADAIQKGIAAARTAYPHTAIVGGIASPCIEGWVAALHGAQSTDEMSRSQACAELARRGVRENRADYVEVVECAELANLSVGCKSLADWLSEARDHLGKAVRGTQSEEHQLDAARD